MRACMNFKIALRNLLMIPITLTAPHIGHLYTSVIADVINRYSSLCNPDRATFLNTGTDEHGLKIQKAAQSAGMEPKEFCDRISKRFRVLTPDASFWVVDDGLIKNHRI